MTTRKRVDKLLVRASVVALALGTITLGLGAITSPAEARAETNTRWMQLPDVARLNESAAIARLEGLGLRCRTEQVAGGQVGHVVATVPSIGSWVDRSHEIVVRVGVPIRVQTLVPRVGRRSLDRVVASLQDIYAIAVRSVRGPARLEGRVIGQSPRVGAQLPFRGILTLDVVDNRTTVPHVEGMRLRAAMRTLEQSGLTADVREVPTAGARRRTVLRQRPHAGKRVAFGTAIRLRVAVPADRHAGHDHGYDGNDRDRGRDRDRGHDRPGGHVDRRPMGVVAVPRLSGLSLADAAARLQAVGLTARVAPGTRGGLVRTQRPAAGAYARPGSEVTLTTRTHRFGWGR